MKMSRCKNYICRVFHLCDRSYGWLIEFFVQIFLDKEYTEMAFRQCGVFREFLTWFSLKMFSHKFCTCLVFHLFPQGFREAFQSFFLNEIFHWWN